MRTYSIALAGISLTYACAQLLLGFAFPDNERLERVACTVGLCATEQLAARAYETFLDGEPEKGTAVESFKTLVIRNPGSPYPWATLAEGLADAGDRKGAKEAMLIAVERGPAIPQIRIRAANLFRELGDRLAAGCNLAVVLQATSAFDETVFDSFRRIPLNNSEILPLLINHRRSARAYFYDIRAHGSTGDLTVVWACLLAAGHADKEMASSYLLATAEMPKWH